MSKEQRAVALPQTAVLTNNTPHILGRLASVRNEPRERAATRGEEERAVGSGMIMKMAAAQRKKYLPYLLLPIVVSIISTIILSTKVINVGGGSYYNESDEEAGLDYLLGNGAPPQPQQTTRMRITRVVTERRHRLLNLQVASIRLILRPTTCLVSSPMNSQAYGL